MPNGGTHEARHDKRKFKFKAMGFSQKRLQLTPVPRTLSLLCRLLALIWLGDIVLLFADSLLQAEPDAQVRHLVWGANLVGAAITVLLLFVLRAFFRRVPWSLAWLRTLSAATALLIVGFALVDDASLGNATPLAIVESLQDWLEALCCVGVFFALRQDSTRRWFHGETP